MMHSVELSNLLGLVIDNYGGGVSDELSRSVSEIAASGAEGLLDDCGFAALRKRIRSEGVESIGLGEVITTQHEEFGEIKWRVAGINHDDICHGIGNPTDHVTLMTLYPIPFATPYGRTSYPPASIAIEWANENFAHGLSEADLDCVVLSKKKYLDDISSGNYEGRNIGSMLMRFFPPSLSELGYHVEGGIYDEGAPYPIFPQGYASCIFRDEDGEPVSYWTRSPNPEHLSDVAVIQRNGNFADDAVSNIHNLVLFCNIN